MGNKEQLRSRAKWRNSEILRFLILAAHHQA